MKNLLFITMAILLMARFGYADPDYTDPEAPADTKKEMESDLNTCPHWGFKLKWDDCTDCHTPKNNMRLREGSPESLHQYAPRGVTIRDKSVHFLLDSMEPAYVQQFFDYLLWHPEITDVTMEVHSPGGSLMNAKRIIGLMNEYRAATGNSITTLVNGWAASAGFYIFMNGDERIVAQQAELMWHELYVGKWLSIETPSSSESEAEVLRHLQDTVNEWLAKRCNLTKEELDEMVSHEELWANGTEAFEYGFATKLRQ